jgi:hypothetical protein
MSHHPSELQSLVEGHLAGALEEAQQERLMNLLHADVEARKLFLEYMDLNAELQWSLHSSRGARLATENEDVPVAASTGFAPIMFEASPPQGDAAAWPFGISGGPLVMLMGGLCALTLITVGLVVVSGRPPAEHATEPKTVEIAAQPQPSSLQLASGMAKLMLPNVGYVVLEGPGEFTLLSEKRARLSSGRIKMRVTEVTGRGFVVETPYGEITDLGTEFGVDLNEQGKAGLVVFEGSVDLRVGNNKQEQKPTDDKAQRLVGGEGVVFNDRGHFDRIGSISTGNVGTFLRSSETSADGSVPLIVEVADNLRTSETKKFYEIVSSGLKEDSLAYVDRPEHDWNGLTKDGMPTYLLGADYVKPFCDDKARNDVKVSVTISRPAKLYVFVDSRLKPPAWLKREFRNTGDKIGLDIGNWRAPTPDLDSDRNRGKGPGNKVDHAFSVWERTITKPGKVSLGPNPENRTKYGNAGMYGIAAVPVSASEAASAASRNARQSIISKSKAH